MRALGRLFLLFTVGASTVIATSFFKTSDAQAARKKSVLCPDVVELLTATVGGSFWERSEPIFTDAKRTRYLTFSYDSEFAGKSLYDILRKYPDELHAIALKEREYSRFELLKLTQMSEKRFAHFGVRPGVDKTKEKYRIDEISEPVFTALIQQREENAEVFFDLVTKEFKQTKLPFALHRDGTAVEATHPTSESSPKKFAEAIDILFDRPHTPDTHLHIGLPVQDVTSDQAVAVARAVEARIVLAMAADSQAWRQGGELSYAASVLAGNWITPKDLGFKKQRGIVQLSLEEFKEPFPAHNLEIRQYQDKQDGMNLAQFVATLTQNRSRLIQNPRRFGYIERESDHYRDAELGNVLGALEYVRDLIGQKGAPGDRDVLARLDALLKKFRKKAEFLALDYSKDTHTTEYDAEIERLIRKYKLLDRLSQPDFYLN